MTGLPKRIGWIDIARGIGIALVVYGHVLRGIAAAHLLSTSNVVWASDYTIYTFHMPLFFVLAGLQVDRSLARGAGRFLSAKVRTIAYPYILWSLFQGAIQLLVPGMLNSPRSPWTLAAILWRPIAQFWFLYVLFLCHLLALLTRARRKSVGFLALICAIGAALAVRGVPNELIVPASLAHWFVFYALGILLSRFLLSWSPKTVVVMVWMSISAISLAVFSHLGRALSHGNADAPASWPSSVAGITLIICMSHLLLRAHTSLARWTEMLGRASMTIYIFHVLAAAGTRVALERLHVTAWLPQLAMGTLMGILAPLLLHLWLEHANLLSALGLGAPRPTTTGGMKRPNIPVSLS